MATNRRHVLVIARGMPFCQGIVVHGVWLNNELHRT